MLPRGSIVDGDADETGLRNPTEEPFHDGDQGFRQLTENIRDIFWMTDIEVRRMLYVSPAYEEIWGEPARVSTKNRCLGLPAFIRTIETRSSRTWTN